MQNVFLKSGRGIGGIAEGEALVTKTPLNLMQDINVWDNPNNIAFTNKFLLPELYGQSLVDKVLVFPTNAGGIFSTNVLMVLASKGLKPKAIVNTRTHEVWVAVALLLGIPIVDQFDRDPTEVIETGDWVKVDAGTGTVEVTKMKRKGRK
jgi:predicted aconitase with swiveling domain